MKSRYFPDPGEILLEDFLKPLSISQYRLAKDIHVPSRRVNEIVLGRRGVSAESEQSLTYSPAFCAVGG